MNKNYFHILLLLVTIGYSQDQEMKLLGTLDENAIYIQKVSTSYNVFDIWLKVVVPSTPYEYEKGKWTVIKGSATFIRTKLNCGIKTYDILKSISYSPEGEVLAEDSEESQNNLIKKNTFYELAYEYLCSSKKL